MSLKRKDILIIEDDVALKAILDRVIGAVSPEARVEWVPSAEQALVKIKERLSKDSKAFDLIVADVFLEGKITGLDFWQTCQSLCPETTVLIMSSMPVDCFLKSIGSDSISPPFLAKPFGLGECKQMLSELLNYRGTGAA